MAATSPRFSFGAFMLDTSRGALTRDGCELKLRPKSYAVLQMLLARHGELVTKQELLDAVWPGVAVTEGSLTQCLIEIRRALGDEGQHLIRTLPRRGFRFDAPVTLHVEAAPSEAPAKPHATQPRRRSRTFALAAVAAAALGAFAVALATWDFGLASTRAQPIRSIAVLPFEDRDAQRDRWPFAHGVAESLLERLAETPGLEVASRESSFSFSQRWLPPGEIARALDVTHVLSGRVARRDGRIRVEVALTERGSREPLWTEVFERAEADVLAAQRELAGEIAEELPARLGASEAHAPVHRARGEARAALLIGRYFYYRRQPGDLERAQREYERAVALTPDFAEAWAGLAGVYGLRVEAGELSAGIWTARQRGAVQRALELDPSLPDAHVRASHLLWSSGERAAADAHARRAATLGGPNHPLAIAMRASYAADEGRFDEAAAYYEQAIRVDPINPVWRNNRQLVLLASGRFEEAWRERAALIELRPGGGEPACILLLLLQRVDQARAAEAELTDAALRDRCIALRAHAEGRTREREAAIGRLREVSGNLGHLYRAEAYAYTGREQAAFEELEAAVAKPAARGDVPFLADLRLSPFLDNLRQAPRWQQLLDAAQRAEH